MTTCRCDAAARYDDNACPIHVDCDEKCQALVEPTTLDEITAAWLHWRDHGSLSGCAHGC